MEPARVVCGYCNAVAFRIVVLFYFENAYTPCASEVARVMERRKINPVLVDKNGNRLVYEPRLSKRLVASGSFIFCAALSAAVYKCYDFALIAFVSALFSVNYWRHPVINSWRRYADVLFSVPGYFICVHLSVTRRYAPRRPSCTLST